MISASEKKRRFISFSLGGLVVAFVILGGSIMLFGPKKEVVNSSVTSAKTDAVQGKAGGEGSEEYNKKMGLYDEKQASEALTAGESYIPTPIGGKSSLAKKVEPEAAPTPPPPPPAPIRLEVARPPSDNNAMLKRMMDDLATLDSRLATASVGQGAVAYMRDYSRDSRATPDVNEINRTGDSAKITLPIKPGDILYAVVDTGVNSDVPSAVMVTVASGKLKNTRLLGKFQRFEERMVIAFNRAILPNGEDVEIEAYAIDPNTTEASVASEVNTHFFSRWGGLIAASFLEGLGEAKRYSGATSNIYGAYGANGTTEQMVWSDYSVADQAWIAAGKVGSKMSDVFAKNFERPPTVKLVQGTPVGVLFMNVSAKAKGNSNG